MNKTESFNLLKALGLVVALFFGGVFLLSAIFDKKHTGPAIEYIYVYTTINGQLYEKEATPADLSSEFVTFGDGTRVPWTAVKTKRLKYYPAEVQGVLTNWSR
jgi:hypothetical protein